MSVLPHLVFAAAVTFAGTVLAAGSDDEPPKETKTTTECAQGTVWDEKTKTCVEVQGGLLDNDTLFDAARELAYAGRTDEALAALMAMTEGDTDRVLTYKGFVNRRAGDVELGLAYYDRALKQNPNNILARSYLGQAYVEQGEMQMAAAELDQIVARGGAGTWAERSLARAIATGTTYSF